jgi:hypothetical protein
MQDRRRWMMYKWNGLRVFWKRQPTRLIQRFLRWINKAKTSHHRNRDFAFDRHSRKGGNPVTFVQITATCSKSKDTGFPPSRE